MRTKKAIKLIRFNNQKAKRGISKSISPGSKRNLGRIAVNDNDIKTASPINNL